MAGLGRSVYYLLGRAELALLIYVDDLLWLIRDKQGLELIPLVIFYLVVLGLPFAWKKFGGGSVLSWVGFEICLQSAKIGLSEQRARWLCRWLDDSVSTGRARIADVSAVLGRLSFGLINCVRALQAFLGTGVCVGSLHGHRARVSAPEGDHPDLQISRKGSAR